MDHHQAVPSSVKFDPSEANIRIAKFWQLGAVFGTEKTAVRVYFDEIASDRACLFNGLHLIRDELQLACSSTSDLNACLADFSVPSVLTTLAHTVCGDRICAKHVTKYNRIMGSRFSNLGEFGEPKIEHFSPAGGGAEDGPTLAHVTHAHMIDAHIKKSLYEGNSKSYLLLNFDMMTHVGRLDVANVPSYGLTKESEWREARNSCGAVIGMLRGYNAENTVHQRLRKDLGEANFAFLSKDKQLLVDNYGVKVDIGVVVAAAIIAVQGLLNTANALKSEMDERGVAHLSASIVVNLLGEDDPLLYCGRATVFEKKVKYQGLGLDAKKYGGKFGKAYEGHSGFLTLTYEGNEGTGYKASLV